MMPWLDDIDLRDAQRLDRSLRDEHTVAAVRRAALEALARMVPADAVTWDQVPAAQRHAAHPPDERYDIVIGLPTPPDQTVVIGLGRAERTFSERDRDLLGLVSPSIRRELCAAEARALAAHPPPGCAVVLLDSYGEILQSGGDADRWLADHFGPAQHPGWLPALVAEWLALPPRPPLVSERAGRRLTVHLLPGDPHALLLEEEVAQFRADALAAAGLTPRETEVLCATQALTDEALVADALFLSRHAVRSRLERVEAKLGVSSGDQAVSCALRASA